MLFQSSRKEIPPVQSSESLNWESRECCQSTFLAKRDSFGKKRKGQSVFLLLGMAIALFVKLSVDLRSFFLGSQIPRISFCKIEPLWRDHPFCFLVFFLRLKAKIIARGRPERANFCEWQTSCRANPRPRTACAFRLNNSARFV